MNRMRDRYLAWLVSIVFLGAVLAAWQNVGPPGRVVSQSTFRRRPWTKDVDG